MRVRFRRFHLSESTRLCHGFSLLCSSFDCCQLPQAKTKHRLYLRSIFYTCSQR